MKKNKKRLDVLLVDEGYCSSREKARAAVMAGHVYVDGEKVTKPGQMVALGAELEVKGSPCPYVSRGGLKLEKAILSFGIDLKDKVVIDVGASTGGFTDCALKFGAKLVYAVDVGYGQLAWELRRDERVVVLERTNIRYLESGALAEAPEVALIDVSFISLFKVLPKINELTSARAEIIALVKPQFEAGREKVGKKGVVKDKSVHREILKGILSFAAGLGWDAAGLDYSPVTGPKGNIEYLAYWKKGPRNEAAASCPSIYFVVEEAHARLKN